jgi:hypothetical protein
LVVAYVVAASAAPRERWQLFAEMWLASFRDEAGRLNEARERLTSGDAPPLASTFYTQAERWAFDQFTDSVLAMPDAWFDELTLDGKAAVPSGVKSVCRDRATQAAVAVAAVPFGRKEDVAELYGIAETLVPFANVLRAGPSTSHPELIEAFAGLGPDLQVT